MAIKRSNLPYELNALEPHVSAQTLSYHYDRHHKGYVDKLNGLIQDTPYDGLALEQIIARARVNADMGVLNNALQAWNHAFLWESMSPNGGGKPDGRIKELIEDEFGEFAKFKEQFRDAALGLFGSGWVWLVDDHGKLRIITTSNADSPVGTDVKALLVLDVWEHAYYLDYQNERARYVDGFLDRLINWNFAAANLDVTEKIKAA